MSEILTIGNYTISDREIDQFIQTLSPEQKMYAQVPQFREQVKTHLRDICLFAMYGKEEGLQESDSYRETIKVAERDILGQLGMAKVLEKVEVSDEQVRAYYDENPILFSSEASVSAKHILMKEENEISALKDDINAGKIIFEDAARQNSTCPSKEKAVTSEALAGVRWWRNLSRRPSKANLMP